MTEEAQVELKPCPFCGGEAEFIECGDDLKPSIQDCWRIACGNLRCGVTDGENFTFVRRAEAIAGWNNQFVPEALQAEIDRLTAENAAQAERIEELALENEVLFYERESCVEERDAQAERIAELEKDLEKCDRVFKAQARFEAINWEFDR